MAKIFSAFFCMVVATLFCTPSIALASSLKNGKVSFLATSNAFDMPSSDVAIKGTPELKDGKLSGKFTVETGKFESGNGTRDEHMRKDNVLNIAQFPTATLVLDPTDVKGSTFTGKLTLRDKTKPIKGTFKAYGDKSFKFEFTISLKAFGIDPPSLIAVYMNDKVDVTAEGDVE